MVKGQMGDHISIQTLAQDIEINYLCLLGEKEDLAYKGINLRPHILLKFSNELLADGRAYYPATLAVIALVRGGK